MVRREIPTHECWVKRSSFFLEASKMYLIDNPPCMIQENGMRIWEMKDGGLGCGEASIPPNLSLHSHLGEKTGFTRWLRGDIEYLLTTIIKAGCTLSCELIWCSPSPVADARVKYKLTNLAAPISREILVANN
ncbi:hypothetical protein CIHG_05235 [Coccidioides immitis H538.4]|uniref:Uncharacterized protein n=3 Tax=Coccidioides immitis TaxID=5501 RepID=A0A0J8R0G4_COCIT|nr:hypothetical protein CIRG_08302 [Coccidioides immitis RMSCC 2394]KMU78624.1 hypothetical protein CISG_01664 [Coccidioides immitis RMSCC 3703]KMU87440.1 hypothetical protein CIHG_05235 [Coccidioides immitis H538.4]